MPAAPGTKKAEKEKSVKQTKSVQQKRKELALKAQRHGERAINYLASIMNSTDEPTKTRMDAAMELLNRGYGRPTQSQVNVDEEGNNAAPITNINIMAADFPEHHPKFRPTPLTGDNRREEPVTIDAQPLTLDDLGPKTKGPVQ